MSQGIINSKPLYLGLSLMFALSSACGTSPASAPPIVTAPQKDANVNSMDVGGEPSTYPDAATNMMDAEAMTPDQGNTFPDAQGPSPDAGFPPAPVDAGFPPGPMDAGFEDATPNMPDTGIGSPDAAAMNDAGVWPDANLDAGPADTGVGTPDTGVMPPPVGDIFEAATRAAQIAAANCAFIERCETFRFQFTWFYAAGMLRETEFDRIYSDEAAVNSRR